jgi:secondary thiamine-phosphate synthase enzyme
MTEFSVQTTRRSEFVDITQRVQEAVDKSKISDGVATVFVPHTTASITINENADPDVAADILHALDEAVRWDSPHYKHSEGNTAAHVKSSMMGHSVQVLVRSGKLQFGTWQGIFLCEFDGPRSRKVWVSIARA